MKITLHIPYDIWKSSGERNVTVYDNDLARGSSIEEAVVIRRFIYLWEKFKEEQKDKIFIQPEAFCKPVGLTVYSFRRIMKEWEAIGFLRTHCMGLPLKKYYHIDEGDFAGYLSEIRAKGMSYSVKAQLDETVNIGVRSGKVKVGESGKILNRGIIGEENNRDVRPAPSARKGGFFGQDREPTWAEKGAQKLEEFIRQTYQLKRTPNRGKWANEFEQLLLDIGDKQRVEQVVLWYFKNYKIEFIPKVFSASDLRKKFTKIEDRMKREMGAAPIEWEADEEDKVMHSHLVDLNWPNGSLAQLPQTIHLSRIAYAQWRKKLVAFRDESGSRMQAWVKRLEGVYLGSVNNFVEGWLKQVNKRVATWKDWNGDLLRYVWNPEHPDFVKMCMHECQQYSSSTALCEDMFKALK